jgi:hypothetical protein
MSTITTVKTEVPRDRWGRPLVIPLDGGKPRPYTRCTTLAGSLDDLYGLMAWKQRQTAVGLADRPDLQLAVTTHRDDKKRLNDICEQALEASKSSAAATTGTAIHSLTELIDAGVDLPTIPDAVRADLDAYTDAMRPFDILAMEQFVVCDELEIAGTFDRLLGWNGTRLVGDLKTGSIEYGLGKIAMQLAIYAHCQTYDPQTGERGDLDVNQRGALVIHLPAGQGRCDIHWIDIARGWEAVQLAVEVRDWRKAKGLTKPFTGGGA